jgi:hypothetical protein
VKRKVIAVPRCFCCEGIHRRYKRYSFAIGFLSGLSLIGLRVAYAGYESLWTTIGLGVVGGAVLASMINDWYFSRRIIPLKHGIKSPEDVNDADVICDMRRQGWVLRDPTPP